MTTYTYRTAEESDSEKIVQFLLDHFLFEEPCVRAMNSIAEEWEQLFREVTESSLRTPISTVVFDESGDVVAVLLNSLWRRDDPKVEEPDTSHLPEKVKTFLNLLQKCHEDFWSLAPEDINVVVYREISSVGRPWQRQGIATKLLQEGLAKAREFGVDGVVSATSSFANQCLLRKRGFKCLKEYPYCAVVNPNGSRALVTDDGSESLQINFKRIEESDTN